MKAAFYSSELERIVSMVESGIPQLGEAVARLPAGHYTDTDHLQREKALFERRPLIVGHGSQLAEPGDFFVHDALGKSWLIVRGDDGVARAFYNYCQHRGTRLVQDRQGSSKRFSCPYHAWTYNTRGELVGVPRDDLFPTVERGNMGLKAGHLEEKYGFLWLTQSKDAARPVDDFLNGFGGEFQQLGIENYSVYFNKTRPLKANWKLPLDAFLESYHIAVLHKESIGSYFVKHVAYSDHFGPHIRSFVPRANVMELKGLDWSEVSIYDYVTLSYIVFPNVCFVFHPTSISVLSLYPGDRPGESLWNHLLLVPRLPETDEQRAHFDKTIRVLDGMTYEGEDFWISEQMQQGLNAGAIDHLTLGLTESQIKRFHDSIEEAIGRV